MTDRKLLELAAKVAGIALYWAEDDPECDWVQGSYPRIPDHKILEKWTWKIWNPLTDDGDALRLAVKLNLDITHSWVVVNGDDNYPMASIHVSCTEQDYVYELKESNPYAATRRAVVRAAAEIGKEMK